MDLGQGAGSAYGWNAWKPATAAKKQSEKTKNASSSSRCRWKSGLVVYLIDYGRVVFVSRFRKLGGAGSKVWKIGVEDGGAYRFIPVLHRGFHRGREKSCWLRGKVGQLFWIQ